MQQSPSPMQFGGIEPRGHEGMLANGLCGLTHTFPKHASATWARAWKGTKVGVGGQQSSLKDYGLLRIPRAHYARQPPRNSANSTRTHWLWRCLPCHAPVHYTGVS